MVSSGLFSSAYKVSGPETYSSSMMIHGAATRRSNAVLFYPNYVSMSFYKCQAYLDHPKDSCNLITCL